MGPRRLTSGDAIAPNVGRGARNGTTAFGQSDLSTSAADNRPARIFIVEDDPVMLHMVADYLEQHNIHAVPASGRQEMIRYFTASEPDLVILDLRLGQEDGFDLLREIRTRSDVPIIITTGDRRDEIDRVVGLELGADDYVTKPFSLRELLARIRAVLRRQEAGRAVSSPAGASSVVGSWSGALGVSPTPAEPRSR
jgi:two-component system OmpR family response regulator